MRERRSEKKKNEIRSLLIAGVFSLAFTTAILFGSRLDSVENVDMKDAALWIQLVTLSILFTGMVRLLWLLLEMLHGRGENALSRAVNRITSVLNIADTQANLAAFLFLLLCWLPVLLAVYPGFFVYDAQDEYIQVATRTFSTHHPLVHVLLLGGMICAVHKLTDSYNLGIVCYMVFQMAAAAGVFTFLFSYLRKRKVSRMLRLIGLLWLGLFPTVVMFTLCSAKDALFTLALLLLLICLLELGRDGEAFFCVKGLAVSFCGKRYGNDASSQQRLLRLFGDGSSIVPLTEALPQETVAVVCLCGGRLSSCKRRLETGTPCGRFRVSGTFDGADPTACQNLQVCARGVFDGGSGNTA